MFKKDQEFEETSAPMIGAQEQDTTESVIGPSVHLEGNFNSSGNVVIVGSLTGSLATSGDVRIEEGAKVQATVTATHIVAAGDVRGDLHAAEQLELAPTARISGNIETKMLSVTPGAILHGKCSMKNIGKQSADAAKKSKTKKGAKVRSEVLEEVTA